MAAATMSAPTDENVKPASPIDLSTIPISPDGDKAESKKNGAAEGDQITVFHDKDNFNVKHPLMHKWTLWFTKPSNGKVYPQTCWPVIVRLMDAGRQLE